MKKTTIWGGLFSALFLCALMAIMPFSSMADNQVSETDYTESETAEEKDDPFRLPETIEQVDWEYALEDELQGMRDMNQKAFVHDGQISMLTSSDPLHYLEAGTWENIDTNIVPTAFGWEVTKNIFKTAFSSDVGAGVAVQMDPNVDPIVVGIAPQIVTLDEAGVAPEIHHVGPSHDAISVGGNVIRYPVADGFDLDYEVSSLEMKQNLVIRQQPVLDESVAWFGLREIIRLPAGYALFIGDEMVGEEIVSTQQHMTIRSLETGVALAEIPVPVVLEPGAEEEYTATYFVSFTNGQIILTTAIDVEWLMDEDRVFPLSLDPTIKRITNAGGYCYRYYGYCYSGNYRYFYRNYGTIYYLPWNKYQFTSANAMPSGSTPSSVKWKQYVSYSNTWGSSSYSARIMMTCGTASTYSYSIASASCSSTPLSVSAGYGGTAQRKMISSIWNSPSVGTFSTGTGWKSVTLSSSASSIITNAANNSDAIGMTHINSNNNYYYMYAYNTGSYNSYLEITYSGGSDSTAPSADFVPYEVTSYKEGARTFFTTLSDSAGIDTTSSGNPRLYYKVNSGSWTGVSATSIGTCSSSAAKCQFKATTASISAGDSVDYYWAFQDLAYSAGMAQSNNFATLPAGGSGSPSSSTPPTTVFNFDVDDVANAGTAKKMTVLTTDVHAGARFTPSKWFDRQVTYYDDNDEYVFEFDTSDCGTGVNACFWAASYYFYSQWEMQWLTTPSNGYNGLGGTQSGSAKFHKDDGGYLSITTNNGPGMNLIYVYDSASNRWAMVGLGTTTGIEEPLSGGDIESGYRSSYGYTQAYNVKIPGDITGTFGKFDFNATYSSSKANWMCVGTNGWIYFFRSTNSNPLCTSGYYYIYSPSYRWNGFAMGSGYYGRMASSGEVSSKVSSVAPTPDTFAPNIDHAPMKDSHSRDRTFTFGITDSGDPPTGLNTSSASGVGPTMYYTITDLDGTVNAQQTKVLSPDDTRANCVAATCQWSAELTDLERGSSISYHVSARDTSTVSSGVNVVTTSATSFEVGDPSKVFIIEWHDMGYTNTYTCTYQVKLYDVTNEIEFHYDTSCRVYYDYSTVGYQDSTRTKGATLRSNNGYMAGGNPFTDNYRITTDASSHGSETFTAGLTEITNYQTAIAGSSNGYPYGYYCSNSYYWNTYKAGCDANIDMPDGFTFDYFGNTFNGSDSTSRVMINRLGAMYLKTTSSTQPERAMANWGTNQPELPYSSNVHSRPNLIAPWWGYYSSYYCYDNTALDCSVRYRVMPFEGKGTDIDADITQDTSWDLVDSPIRINPSGDYLSVNANLNIEPGVVVQVAQGKGISFDGACDTLTVTGNDTDGDNNHVRFEGQFGQTWTGMAFTNSCTATDGTNDRHQLSYVDFANTTDYTIAAGSRHGSSPSSNANVGNFTMDHVTFSNVKGAVSHGSGQGTVFDISDFEVNDASESCFLFPDDAIVTLTDGEMDGCNSDNSNRHGAVTDATSGASGSSSGAVSGSLTVENVVISDSEANLIRSFAENIYISNVSATSSTTEAKYALRLLGSGGSGTHSAVINNFTATSYDLGVKIGAADSYSLTNVDIGTSTLTLSPGTSTTSGPAGDDAVIDSLAAGGMSIERTLPTMSNIDLGAGDLTITGNSPSSVQTTISDLDAGGIGVSGCGYNLYFLNADISDTSDTGYLSGSCSSSAAQNTILVEGGTMESGTSSNNMIYARNSKITLGGVAITGQTAMGNYVAKASTNGRITLIDVTFGGNDCADAGGDTGDCWLEVSSSSGSIWLGGIGTATTFKEKDSVRTLKPGTTVTSFVMDGSGASLFMVGSQITGSTGEADVWTISGTCDTNGCSSHDHGTYFDAYGPAGIHSAANTSFGIGDETFLRLTQPPITLSDSGMDCAFLATNQSMSALDPDGDGIYVLDDGSILLDADLSLDGCTLRMTESKFIIRSDATSSPTLTISNGGELELVKGAGGTFSELKAASAAYPLHITIGDGGTLDLQGAYARNIAQDSTQKGALIIGPGATVSLTDGSVVYGDAASSTDMATIKVNGGTLSVDDASVINNGGTGTGIWFEQTGSTLSDITVSNAAVGMKSHNAAPVVNGFTLSNNDVGLDFFGGMALPTIYRSTLLSGESTGWQTHELDLTSLIGKQYVQLGFESVFAGGNAHPRYNYFSNKYYNIYDRMQYEVTLDDGTVFNYSIDQAGKDSAGYWDDATSENSDYGGWGNYSCGLYGYAQNPAYRDYGYYYYFHNYGPYTQSSNGYSGANAEPNQFGFRWEAGETSSASSLYYPYHYWGYYWPASQFGSSYQGGIYEPPSGFDGLWSNYNVCIDYAYTYYQSPGSGARMAMPIIDTLNTGTNPGTSGNIVGLKGYIDVLHKGADYYQDRMDFVARASNNDDDMGDWARESGKPTFTEGTITGADVGIEIGGNFAAAVVENVEITSPTTTGVKVSGSTAASFDYLNVSGGSYGAYTTLTSRGKLHLNNVDFDNQDVAGVSYLKDISGDLSGSITNSAGAAVSYGVLTTAEIDLGIDLSGNAIGVSTAGSGDINLNGNTFANTKDFVISGASTVTFIDGIVDESTVDVTGNGVFNRARSLIASLTADSNDVVGANVYLMDATGKPTGTGLTDANGDASGITYFTAVITKAGIVNPVLSGYKLATVAKIGTYSTSNADFRYYYDSVTLDANAATVADVSLTDKFDARVCYSFTSSAYKMIAPCAGYLSTNGKRTTTGLVEYGYYGAVDWDMSGKTIMVDAPFMYIKGKSGTNINDWSDTTVFNTGSYDYYGTTRYSATSPYNGKMHIENSTMIALSGVDEQGVPYGFDLGYYAWSDINPYYKNSTFIGLQTIAAANEYGNLMPSEYIVEDNIIVSNTPVVPGSTSFAYDEMCIVNGAVNDAVIARNQFTGCAIGVRSMNTIYSYQYAASTWGADNMTIEGNTFDGGVLDVWFALGSYSDDNVVRNNIHMGATQTEYAIYAQDRNTVRPVIEGNTIYNAKEPIYMRGALDWDISDNTIYGDGNSGHAGIYVKDGYGSIDGNTLVDADGGILVDGLSYGYSASVTNNEIYQSNGRTAVSAVGIWAEDCGTSTLETGGNDITIMGNALVTDGCDIEDTGSVFTGTGGSGGMVYTVNIMAGYFAPQNLSINEGDTVKWRLQNYSSGTNYQHGTISNDTDGSGSPLWDSGAMNLGGTFTRLFDTAGTYDYSCTNHPTTMWGTITVASGSTSSFTSIGLDVVGTNDDISLNGTEISGFTTAYEQSGGSLFLNGGADLEGGDYAVDIDGTDVSSDGGKLSATSATGVGLYFTGGGALALVDLSTDAPQGVYIDGSTDGLFDWNGGTVYSGTGLYAVDKAEGDIQNMTWTDASTQIYAGSDTKITSVGNTLDVNKLIVVTGAEVHEANLLDLNVNHLGAASSNVGLLITSDSGNKAAYVSPDMRNTGVLAVGTAGDAGDLSDWVGNVDNPSDDLMPGVMSSDGAGEDFMATWDETNLFLALTGVDMDNGDLMIFLDTADDGSTDGWEWDGTTPSLGYSANYAFWAEDGSDSPNDGDTTYSYSLKKWRGDKWDDSLGCTNMAAHVGWTDNSNTELKIPWDCIGSPSNRWVRMSVVVLEETGGAVASNHPSSGYLSMNLGKANLGDGTLSDERLNYRSYIGSTTPSPSEDYNILAKVDADCAEDWGNIDGLDMSVNRNENIDILRACPIITGIEDVSYAEDSGAHTISLTDKADDVQDSAASLSWTLESDVDADGDLLTVVLVAHDLTITPKDDEFGTYLILLTVEDSNGLSASKSMLITVNNVNDAPIICNTGRTDCMPVFSDDGFDNLNVLDEGFGSHSKPLGLIANSAGSYIIDQANEQTQTLSNSENVPQAYIFDASVPSECGAFSVAVANNELSITEVANNELGGVCTVTLTLSDGASVNDAASSVDVDFTVNPVNDVPVIPEYDVNTAAHLTTGEGVAVATPWSVSVIEDTGCVDAVCANTDALTFDLSGLKADDDHNDADLTWTWEATSSCDVDNYFEDISFNGNDLEFTLIQDAATNVPSEEIDFLDDGGIHQQVPLSGEYCPIKVVLSDSPSAPSYIPNYGLSTATYNQETTSTIFSIRVENTREMVADYLLDVDAGFDFNSVNFIMPGTNIPIDVDIQHEGDEGPYKYDQLLKVQFLSNGAGGLATRDTQFIVPPAWGQSVSLGSKVLIDESTTRVGVRVDVLTCKAASCPSPSAATPTDFITNSPAAHRAADTPNSAWSEPGAIGYDATTGVYSQRRPALEDGNWSNNAMFSSLIASDPSGILDSGQDLPVMVDTMAPSAVPSFAPGLVAISAAGLFVAGLMLASQRRIDDDEEFVQSALVDDERAVSPVIATILMVAITVVLSGVVYVWASDLADQPSKSVPRIAFKVEKTDPGTNGYWSIIVTSAKEPIATQATVVMVEWVNDTGSQIESFKLSNSTGTYGFAPINSESFITFSDSIKCEAEDECTSTYGDGDAIHIRMSDPSGFLLKDNGVRVTLKYVPQGVGTASVLKTFNLEI